MADANDDAGDPCVLTSMLRTDALALWTVALDTSEGISNGNNVSSQTKDARPGLPYVNFRGQARWRPHPAAGRVVRCSDAEGAAGACPVPSTTGGALQCRPAWRAGNTRLRERGRKRKQAVRDAVDRLLDVALGMLKDRALCDPVGHRPMRTVKLVKEEPLVRANARPGVGNEAFT